MGLGVQYLPIFFPLISASPPVFPLPHTPAPIPLQLLDYMLTTLLFSDKKVDSNLVAWNRVVLLHGRWGLGRTGWTLAPHCVSRAGRRAGRDGMWGLESSW